MIHLLALLLCGLLAACGKESAGEPEPAPGGAAAVYEATTGDDGSCELRDAAGAIVFVAVALEESGAPLPDLTVTYLGSATEPLVLFTRVSGDPVATFAVTPGATRRGISGVTDDYDVGVFILSLVDLTRGHLYDPLRDGFAPGRTNTLRSIRALYDYDDLSLLLDGIEGIRERSTTTVGELRERADGWKAVLFEKEQPASERARIFAQRILRVFTFAAGRSASYRVVTWKAIPDEQDADETFFVVPLGVQLSITLDAPLNGHTYVGVAERDVQISGRIAEEPLYVTTDGGRVDLVVAGAVLGGALDVGGDGTGGSRFSSTGPLRLTPGENRIEVIAYAGEVGRGFQTPLDGEVGRATVTVTYEEGNQGDVAPVLSALAYPSSVGGPDGTVPLRWHFSDADADIARFHEKLIGVFNGESYSSENEAAVADLPALSCMLDRADGDCAHELTYSGIESGSFTYEIWVIDAGGRPSNHVTATVSIASGRPPALPGDPSLYRVITIGRLSS